MKHEVVVVLPQGPSVRASPDCLKPMTPTQGRQWLDAQFAALGCRPLRASGKVLLADKVLLVAQSAAPEYWADSMWRDSYVRAVHAVLQVPHVRVDVPALEVVY